MKAKPLILFLALGAVSQTAYAQGQLVRHGFAVTMPEFAIGRQESYVGFRVGYHFEGTIEAGLGLERRDDFDTDVVTVSLAPGIAVYPIRQRDGVPLTMRVGASFERQSLEGDPITALEEEGILSKGQAWRIEAALSRRTTRLGRLARFPVACTTAVSFAYRNVRISHGQSHFRATPATLVLGVLFDMDVGGLAHVVSGPRAGILDDGFAVGFSLGLTAGYDY